MRELPQVLNSSHYEFFAITVNGCSNPRLDAVITERGWNAAAPQPVVDPGTGLGSDTGFPNLFQDSKYYAYMYWGDLSDPPADWNTKEEACESMVGSAYDPPQYVRCLQCLGTKGYFKVDGAEGDDSMPPNPNFILWGRFLNFNPPKYALIRAAIKQALKEVKNARVGFSSFSLSTPYSTLVKRQNASCSQTLTDPNAFDSSRASYVSSMNGLRYNTTTPMARTLLNIGYYFTSGDDIYRDIFGFGTSYNYPASYRNDLLTSQSRSWCWGDQASSLVIISDGDPTNDSLSAAMINRLAILNGGPVYCPDSAPCGDYTGDFPDKGYDPVNTSDDNPNFLLDDVAKLLANQDLQRATPAVVGDFDTRGTQSLRIHTISYGYANNLLRNTATVGKGLYFTAQDPTTLQSAVKSILCSAGAKTSACTP